LGTSAITTHTGLSVPIPVALPTPIQSILGPGGPALNVSGSESIRLSGTSNWTNQQTGVLGQKRSLFPSLDMQQDLNIQLEGQLSDRVKVNLLQNSANQVPLANRIAINYRGDEDDLVQALDLGNTSLALPGTQYVSYSGRNEGLFGVKIATRLGPMDLTALASKQEGRSERASYSGGASQQTSPPIYDYDYIKGQYFLISDHVLTYDHGSLRVYKDDRNPTNNHSSNSKPGAA
jgi:cell surface protein SprA